MKVFTGLLFLLVATMGNRLIAQTAPKISKTEFSKLALSEMVYTTEGDSISIKKVLDSYKKNIVVIDLWAGWCKDCLAVMQGNEEIRKQFPKAKFLLLSLDRSDTAWKKAIVKHDLTNETNYWLKAGWKNKFTENIDLNWIPRYLVVGKKSKIKGYYFVDPKDPAFVELMTQLSE